MITAPGLSFPALAAFNIVRKVHGLWTWYRRIKIYSNVDNFLRLAGGIGLNVGAGDKKWVSISALCLQTVVRIEAVVMQIKNLSDTTQRIRNSFKDEFSPPIKYINEAQYKTKLLALRIKILFSNIFTFIKETFLLIMRIMDTLDVFNMKPEKVNEAINIFFVNGKTLMEGVVSSIPELKRLLAENRLVIRKMLNAMKSKKTVNEFINDMNTLLDNVVVMNSTCSQGKAALKELGKTMLSGFLFYIQVIHGELPPELKEYDYRIPNLKKKCPRYAEIAVKC